MQVARHALLLCALLGSSGCFGHRVDAEAPATNSALRMAAPSPPSDATSGVLDLLTYNVAGLPGPLSSSHPSVNTAQVSPLLNHYHLVVAQEDFAYHGDLVKSAGHLYQVAPMPPSSTVFGDGLSILSVYPLDDISRVRWLDCNGYFDNAADCFGEKGFSVARVTLTQHVSLDLYNLHAEAGDSERDVDSRRRGFEQLARYIVNRGNDPVDRETLRKFEARTGLVDMAPKKGPGHASLDRVLVRGSRALDLEPLAWRADGRFVDDAGQALSDHPAIAVRIAWNARDKASTH